MTLRHLLRFVFLVLATVGSVASAHWADLAVAEFSTGNREVSLTLTYATGLTSFADDDGNGRLSASEIKQHSNALEAVLGDKIRVTSGGEAGQVEIGPAIGAVNLPTPVAEGTHTTVALTYRWRQDLSDLVVRYDLFVPGVSTASCLATILHNGEVQSVVFAPENREFTIGENAAPADFRSFATLGIEHILAGYDHLLFLLVLLVTGGGFRQLLKTVTAFTIAHSITLALTVLGVLSLPSQIVESAIALSIVYIAAENLFRRNSVALQRQRLVVTFGFGLLHGMGFAGLL